MEAAELEEGKEGVEMLGNATAPLQTPPNQQA